MITVMFLLVCHCLKISITVFSLPQMESFMSEEGVSCFTESTMFLQSPKQTRLCLQKRFFSLFFNEFTISSLRCLEGKVKQKMFRGLKSSTSPQMPVNPAHWVFKQGNNILLSLSLFFNTQECGTTLFCVWQHQPSSFCCPSSCFPFTPPVAERWSPRSPRSVQQVFMCASKFFRH